MIRVDFNLNCRLAAAAARRGRGGGREWSDSPTCSVAVAALVPTRTRLYKHKDRSITEERRLGIKHQNTVNGFRFSGS